MVVLTAGMHRPSLEAYARQRSNAPISVANPRVRGNPLPRWSVTNPNRLLPRSIATLPSIRAIVGVGPPLLRKVWSLGFDSQRVGRKTSPGVLHEVLRAGHGIAGGTQSPDIQRVVRAARVERDNAAVEQEAGRQDRAVAANRVSMVPRPGVMKYARLIIAIESQRESAAAEQRLRRLLRVEGVVSS